MGAVLVILGILIGMGIVIAALYYVAFAVWRDM